LNLQHRRIHIAKIFEETSGQVFRRTKGHKERWLGINDSLSEALIEYRNLTRYNKSSDPVICDQQGQRLYERYIRYAHKRLCQRAGVKSLRVHDLRHTYASHYIMNGGSLVELQSLLGHSSPTMTLKYAHLAPGYLEKKASVVSFSLPKENVVPFRKIK
jgi:site-specific recombinase XerD